MPDKGGPLAIFMYYWLDLDIFIIVSHLGERNVIAVIGLVFLRVYNN